MKNRKIKIKEKYSRKRGGSGSGSGGLPVPLGPPPVGSESEEALKLVEEAKKLEEAAKKKAELKSSGSGLNIQLKTLQNDLFAKLNTLNPQQLKNLTTPMIEAVKRISSRPEMESGPKKMTIYDEIDRFLVSLNDKPPNLELYPSQIYYIDKLLQSYNSRSPKTLFNPIDSKSKGNKLYAFDDDRFIKLKSKVTETVDLQDTSLNFKDHLRKMLADIEEHRNKKMKPADLKLTQSISSKPKVQSITQSIY